MDKKADELVSVIQVGVRDPIYFIGDPVVEVLIEGKIVAIKGGEIEVAEILDPTSFEPRVNQEARQPKP